MFRDVKEGTYYPAASLYTLPEQTEGATVTFNFGAVSLFVRTCMFQASWQAYADICGPCPPWSLQVYYCAERKIAWALTYSAFDALDTFCRTRLQISSPMCGWLSDSMRHLTPGSAEQQLRR
jgi:hypothetical protein